MSEILRETAAPALQEMGLWYLLDPESGALVVPFSTDAGGTYLIQLQADDDLEEAIVRTSVTAVPPSRAERVAVLLAQLNARYWFVTFSMDDGRACADVCVELTHSSDPGALICLGYHRLTAALEEAGPSIERAARLYGRRPRVLREAEQILDRRPGADP